MTRACWFFVAISVISAKLNAFETQADEVQFDTKKHICHLTGNVIAKINGKTFMADKVVIYMKNNLKKPNKVIAIGNVTYSDDRLKVKAKNCECDMATVTFRKDVIIEGEDYGVMKADRIVYQIKTGIVNITAKKRVKFVLDSVIERKLQKKK